MDVRTRVAVATTALSVESTVPCSVVPVLGRAMSAWDAKAQVREMEAESDSSVESPTERPSRRPVYENV